MAGIDGILSPEFTENDGISLTNASGMYSPSLSEHCLLSCLYFAKDVDRWKRNQKMRKWEQYDVTQISGATLGVIGYGDIGKSSARKAKAMGMKVIAQRRRPELFEGDGIADQMFGPGQAPITLERKRMYLGEKQEEKSGDGGDGEMSFCVFQPRCVWWAF
ncbi:unnamed protein product [Laminaria digitata]